MVMTLGKISAAGCSHPCCPTLGHQPWPNSHYDETPTHLEVPRWAGHSLSAIPSLTDKSHSSLPIPSADIDTQAA